MKISHLLLIFAFLVYVAILVAVFHFEVEVYSSYSVGGGVGRSVATGLGEGVQLGDSVTVKVFRSKSAVDVFSLALFTALYHAATAATYCLVRRRERSIYYR